MQIYRPTYNVTEKPFFSDRCFFAYFLWPLCHRQCMIVEHTVMIVQLRKSLEERNIYFIIKRDGRLIQGGGLM